MQTDHFIAKCQWESGFDRQEQSAELQNFLSRWSNWVLPAELERYFNKICPRSQTWRIDTLELHLGTIDLEDVNDQLPRRLNEALEEAFRQLILQKRLPANDQTGTRLEIVESRHALLDYVHWFLLNGSAPWWYGGNENPADIFVSQLEQSPEQVTDIIRALGIRENVRRRLVWQTPLKQTRQVIKLLEPWQGDFICTTADNLFALQKEHELVQSNPAQFQQEVWFIILTHLLVERGSLFNTAAFLTSTLEQLARHYKISYAELVEHLANAVGVLKTKSLISNNFIAAIHLIHNKQHSLSKQVDNLPQPVDEKHHTPGITTVVDYWHHLQKMIVHDEDEQLIAGERVHITALLEALAGENGKRLANLVRQHAQSRQAQQGLIKNLHRRGLECLIKVLAPHDHQFILTHREHSHQALKEQSVTETTLWQIILAYLIVDRGSHFNRRQFVHDTLLAISQQQQLDYLTLLTVLMSLSVKQANGRRFELFAIFQDLCEQAQKQFWVSTPRPPSPVAPEIASNEPALNAKWILRRFNHSDNSMNAAVTQQALARALGLTRVLEIGTPLESGELSRMLLQSLHPGGLRQLLDALAPWATAFCHQLLLHIDRWHRESRLPSISKLDTGFTLPALFVQSLLLLMRDKTASRASGSPEAFWRKFTGLLHKETGTPVAIFTRDIARCLDLELRGGSRAGTNYDWLNQLREILPSLPSPELTSMPVSHNRTNPVNITEMIQAASQSRESCFKLLEQLLTQQFQPDTERTRIVAELWPVVQHRYKNDLYPWLSRHRNKPVLLSALLELKSNTAIGRWWQSLLPGSTAAHREYLAVLHLLFDRHIHHRPELKSVLEKLFFLHAFDNIGTRLSTPNLLARIIAGFCRALNEHPDTVLEILEHKRGLLTQPVLQAALKQFKGFYSVTDKSSDRQENAETGNGANRDGKTDFIQDLNGCYIDHPDLIEIAGQLLCQGQPPRWVEVPAAINPQQLLFDLLSLRPHRLLQLLKMYPNHAGFQFRLQRLVSLSLLLKAIARHQPNASVILQETEHLRQYLENTPLAGLNSEEKSAPLVAIALVYWCEGRWQSIDTPTLLNDYCWALMQQHEIKPRQIHESLCGPESRLSKKMQLCVDRLFQTPFEERAARAAPSTSKINRLATVAKSRQTINLLAAEKAAVTTVPLAINNAGLVLIQSYIKPLFERLKLIDADGFISAHHQRRAVHYLQYIAAGQTDSPEHYLLLNKLLCGLPFHEPVEPHIDISTEETNVCQSLIGSIIDYWSAIGKSSVEGFRGNWLIREGTLSANNDHWDLIVVKRAYDVLLNKYPLSYSVIKLPWMQKAIYVTWPAV